MKWTELVEYNLVLE